MKSAFELKSTRLSALAVRFAETDLAAIRAHLTEKAEQYRMFEHMALVADFADIQAADMPDLTELKALFAEFGLHLTALRHLPDSIREQAAEQGWLCANSDKAVDDTDSAAQQEQPENSDDAAENAPNDTNGASDDADNQSTNDATEPTAETERQPEARPTVVVDTPVRTGQQVYAENADLIVLGMVSEGAEVIADGNIHIYAPMRGRALAGEKGNKNARIFIQSMQAELVSVAGIYRVFEQDLPAHLHKQPVRIELVEDRLAVSAIDAQ